MTKKKEIESVMIAEGEERQICGIYVVLGDEKLFISKTMLNWLLETSTGPSVHSSVCDEMTEAMISVLSEKRDDRA